MSETRTVTVREAVNRVAGEKWLLPGIQRDFKWNQPKIISLFDSLMQDYPIGTILLWKTRQADNQHLRFRRLQLGKPGADHLQPAVQLGPTALVHGILDGQQRLTALNLGLRGCLGRSDAPTYLHIDLDTDDKDSADAENNRYRFDFRTSSEGDDGAWFRVRDALGLDTDVGSLNTALQQAGLMPSATRRSVLKGLALMLNKRPAIHLVEEVGADLHRVLSVFARANNGVTKLTYVDLLVGTVTQSWKHLDARVVLTELRNEMNAVGEGFQFSIDRIVKAALVLLDVPDPKFRVERLMGGNPTYASRLEADWVAFRDAMLRAVRLLDWCGLSGSSLPAQNLLIPIAYYVYKRKPPAGYLIAHAHEKDRQRVRAFVLRTLVQRQYWTGAVDPVFKAVRLAINTAQDQKGFPLADIERRLKAAKKPIAVDDDLIRSTLDLRYENRNTAAVLRVLFPHMVHEGPHPSRLDKDHIFPRSKATTLGPEVEMLPNLQLVNRYDNGPGDKGAKLPADWWKTLSNKAKNRYARQFVTNLPQRLDEAPQFWSERRQRLETLLKEVMEP